VTTPTKPDAPHPRDGWPILGPADGMLFKEDAREEADIIRDAHAATPPAPAVNIDRVLTAMAEQHQTNAARITAMEGMIQQLARTLAATVAAPVAPVAPAAPANPLAGLDQVVAIAKMLRDVAAPAPQTTMKDSMEMMMMVLDMRERIAAGVPRDSGDGGTLGAVLPALVGPLAELLSRQAATTPPAAVAAPAPAPTAAISATTHKPPAPMPPAPTTPVGKLLATLPVWAKLAITAQAEANADVDAIADHVLAAVPDSMLESVLEIAGNTETTVEELVALIPKWLPYRKWLRELLDAIHAKLNDMLNDGAGGEQQDDDDEATDARAADANGQRGA
jgi:hypothetical protein